MPIKTAGEQVEKAADRKDGVAAGQAVATSNSSTAARAREARGRDSATDENQRNSKDLAEMLERKAAALEVETADETLVADHARISETAGWLRDLAKKWQTAAALYESDPDRASLLMQDARDRLDGMLEAERRAWEQIEHLRSLDERHGLRSRGHHPFFNDSDVLEQRFSERLPLLVDGFNKTARELNLPFEFGMGELASLFVEENETVQLRSYGRVGDSRDLEAWFGPEESEWEGERDSNHNDNERGTWHYELQFLMVQEAFEANAARYAESRDGARGVVEGLGHSWAELPLEGAFQWTTVYAEGGADALKTAIEAGGLDDWQSQWTSNDPNGKFGSHFKDEGLWRPGTWQWFQLYLCARWTGGLAS